MKTEEPKAMREIHEIREKMYEDIKDMPPQEIIAYIKTKAAEHEKRSGVKLPKLTRTVDTHGLTPVALADGTLVNSY